MTFTCTLKRNFQPKCLYTVSYASACSVPESVSLVNNVALWPQSCFKVFNFTQNFVV